MVVRVGIVDLISTSPDSMTRRVFLAAVAGSEARTDPPAQHEFGMAAPVFAETQPTLQSGVETTVFGIAPTASPDTVGWPALAAMDALVISGSEPLSTGLATEPSVAIIDRLLHECAATTSILFSCQSAHAALHLLHGLERHRLPRRCHGTFTHTVASESGHPGIPIGVDPPLRTALPSNSLLDDLQLLGRPEAETKSLQLFGRADAETDHPRPSGLAETGAVDFQLRSRADVEVDAILLAAPAHPLLIDLTTPVLVPHSRWNVMSSADLRAAGVPILLDSAEAEWHLATSPDGLRHVFLQGHPEYFADTMAREYRRDLRRWIADPARPFPDIPLHYFPELTHARLLHHAELVRAQRDPVLLEDFPLPSDYADTAHDWSSHSRQFFTNWLRAVEQRISPDELLAA